MNFLDRALPLIEPQADGQPGFSVIPLEPGQKKPVPVLGAHSRSNNEDVIRYWAEKYPEANVGICADVHYTLLETDDETRFRELIASMTFGGIPETKQLGSGRPNRCCWILRRAPWCGEGCLEVPGLFEFRNKNQYVAAPGSIHPEGYTYKWFNDGPIAKMPREIVKALTQLDAGYQGQARSEFQRPGAIATFRLHYRVRHDADDLLNIPNLVIGEGERHYTLMSLAGMLHDGEREAEDIVEILQQIRDTYFVGAGDKGNYEIENVVDFAMKKTPNAPMFRRITIGGKVVR